MIHSIMQEAKISPIRKRNVMNGKKGVGMQRSCEIFHKIFMHTKISSNALKNTCLVGCMIERKTP